MKHLKAIRLSTWTALAAYLIVMSFMFDENGRISASGIGITIVFFVYFLRDIVASFRDR